MSEPTKPRRPWWAAALIGGAAAGATIVAALGPRTVKNEAIAATPQPKPVDEEAQHWRERMELLMSNQSEAMVEVRERLARIEGRLERR